MDIHVRAFAPEDQPAVAALCEWAWWPARSAAGWRWLAMGPPGSPGSGQAGWVVEREGRVGGFVGNLVQRFSVLGEERAAATGHSLLVDPAFRGAGRQLLSRFAGQPGVFAAYTLNANDRSAPMYRRFGMHPWPEGLSNVRYVWRTDWAGVAEERALRWLNRIATGGAGRGGGERFVTDRPWTQTIGWRAPGVVVIGRDRIDDRFDALWARLRREHPVLAFRDAATLRWRCSDPDMTTPPVLLGYEADGELAGYLLAMFGKGSQVEQPALDIIDVIALKDAARTAVPALVRTLVHSAARIGAARVRLQAVSPALDRLLTPLAAARQTYGYDHCHVRWRDDFRSDLRTGWFATPYDGDYSFCLRPLPVPARRRAA